MNTQENNRMIELEIISDIDYFDKYYDEIDFDSNELSEPYGKKGSSKYFINTNDKGIADGLVVDGWAKIVTESMLDEDEVKYIQQFKNK